MAENRKNNVMRDRTLALAGLIQALSLVQQLARQGKMVEISAFQTSIDSIFVTDADTVDDIYGGIAGLSLGLRLTRYHLGGSTEIPTTPLDRERVGYLFAIIRLARQLQNRPAMLTRISAGIELARNLARNIPRTHPDILENLASLYTETISNLDFRILIAGDQQYLSLPEHANTIRALLLAGVRSAVLLHQRGGRRWMLLFHRNALLKMVMGLMKSLIN